MFPATAGSPNRWSASACPPPARALLSFLENICSYNKDLSLASVKATWAQRSLGFAFNVCLTVHCPIYDI